MEISRIALSRLSMRVHVCLYSLHTIALYHVSSGDTK